MRLALVWVPRCAAWNVIARGDSGDAPILFRPGRNDGKSPFRGRRPGVGAQLTAIFASYAMCACEGCSLVYKGLWNVGHDENLTEWQNFVGLPRTPRAVNATSHGMQFYDYLNASLIGTCLNASLPALRRYYWSTPKPQLPPNETEIVVHLRRGDVVNDPAKAFRVTPDETYVRWIDDLRRKYPAYTITIHSEGMLTNFSDALRSAATSFRLNAPAVEAFHSFVTAKVLVMAKSSFSYTAAFLNENHVYYPSFWHEPLSRWNQLD